MAQRFDARQVHLAPGIVLGDAVPAVGDAAHPLPPGSLSLDQRCSS
jgi:hypothetical protein